MPRHSKVECIPWDFSSEIRANLKTNRDTKKGHSGLYAGIGRRTNQCALQQGPPVTVFPKCVGGRIYPIVLSSISPMLQIALVISLQHRLNSFFLCGRGNIINDRTVIVMNICCYLAHSYTYTHARFIYCLLSHFHLFCWRSLPTNCGCKFGIAGVYKCWPVVSLWPGKLLLPACWDAFILPRVLN